MDTQDTTQKQTQQTNAPSSDRDPRRGRGGNPNKRRQRRDTRPRSEFDQKIIGIRRVTRVMAGGRRFSFSVCLVAGNRSGKVGVGVGKAGDTALAIEKAFRHAKRNMIDIAMTDEKSIPHDVIEKYCASKVLLMPAPGRGVKAGGAVRSVLELGGVTDVSAKILSRSKNHINNARVAIEALKRFSTTRNHS